MIPAHANTQDDLALTIDGAAVCELLRTAARRAQESGELTVISYSQPLPQSNLLAAYAAAQEVDEGSSFFWERPSEGYTLLGIGEAASHTAVTPAEMAQWWQKLIRFALIYPVPDISGYSAQASGLAGPLCFGGFAFDATQPLSPHWRNFSTGLLILPEIQIAEHAARTFLTVNLVIEPWHSDELGRDGAGIAAAKLAHAESLFKRVSRYLRQPLEVIAPGGTGASPRTVSIHDPESRRSWNRMIIAATEDIQAGTYRKVVLARSVETEAPKPFKIAGTLANLRQRYASAYIFALTRGDITFLGASPEQLARVVGGRVETMALAGSAPRGSTVAEDERLASQLLTLEKTAQEHVLVSAGIRSTLEPLTARLDMPEQPQILKLPNVQHLLTPIGGDLLAGTGVLDVVAALHPTAAVAGEPRDAAISAIRRYEQLDRGWYAGPIGWIGSDGSGEFAVALRSAVVEGTQATLFAGCGIVAGSDPEAEFLESGWKLQVMLETLSSGEDH